MAEHYTKSTVEASLWCKKCARDTPHRIYGGRKGPCKVCLAKLESAPKKPPAAEQGGLFG